MKGSPNEPRCGKLGHLPFPLFVNPTDTFLSGFSKQIVAILNDNSAKYSTFDILSDNDVREGLKKFSNWPTYPQLYINGELFGGLDIVKELQASGELRAALQGTA